jgi:hypothetical protein
VTPTLSTFIDRVLRAELSAGAKLVGVMLRRLQGGSDYAWPTVDELGARVGLGKRATLDALAQLRKAGFVEVHDRRHMCLSSQYVCTLPQVRASAPALVQESAPGEVHESAHRPIRTLDQVQESAPASCTSARDLVQIGASHLSKQFKEEVQERESAPTLVVYPGNAARVAWELAVSKSGGIAMDTAGPHRELVAVEAAAERVIRMRAPALAARDLVAKRDELLDEWARDFVAERRASAESKGGAPRLKAVWFAEACEEAAAAGGRMPTPNLSRGPALKPTRLGKPDVAPEVLDAARAELDAWTPDWRAG